jgi:hypothetical protein
MCPCPGAEQALCCMRAGMGSKACDDAFSATCVNCCVVGHGGTKAQSLKAMNFALDTENLSTKNARKEADRRYWVIQTTYFLCQQSRA